MDKRPLGPEACAEMLDVSRETLDRLALYVELLQRWQRTINLVGRSTLDDPWRRHVLDSGQLLRHLPRDAPDLVDLGSGAGLPGLILAILGVPNVHLIESDRRKAAFLREAARATATPVSVHACRIEALERWSAGVITARALAPLPRLLKLSTPLLSADTVCLFLKGRSAADELTSARKTWHIMSETLPSLADPSGAVLKLRGIRRARDRQS